MSTQTSAPDSASVTSQQLAHPGNGLSPPSPPHPLEIQISSITQVLQNRLALMLATPASTPKNRKSQISSITEMVRGKLVLLGIDPKQRESLGAPVTDELQKMLALILSMPPSAPAQRESRILFVTQMLREMLFAMVPVPSIKDPNPESKQSAPLPDTQTSPKSSGGRYSPTLFSQSSPHALVDNNSDLQTHATKIVSGGTPQS